MHVVSSSRGGGAEHVRCLVKGLDRTRFVAGVAMPEDGGNVAAGDFEGTAFLPLNIAVGFSPREVFRLRRFIKEGGKEGGFDLIHCHGMRAALFGRLTALSLLWKRPRVVFTVHGFATPHYRFLKRTGLLWLERALSPVTDAVICVSEAEREAFTRAGLAADDKVRVVWNGIDLDRFRAVRLEKKARRLELGLPVGAFLLTTVCRLYQPRDLDTLLRAFASVRREMAQAHLLIVGDGPDRSQVEQAIEALGLGESVTLAGIRRDVPEILAASDLFVLASARWEGLPLTVLEAMASGLPAVVSDVGGTGEALQHGVSGLLVPPRDVPRLAEAVLTLARDEEKRRRMGESGRARAEALFGLDRMSRQTEEVYETLLARSEKAT